MENIFQYHSDTSDNESDNEIKLSPQPSTVVNLKRKKPSEETSKLPSSLSKTINQYNFDGLPLNRNETGDHGKKSKGYISKRIKLQEANEKNLESQQKEQTPLGED